MSTGQTTPEPEDRRAAIAAALQEYARTEDHLYECAAYSEGLACCIDEEHVNFSQLLDVILRDR